MSTNPESSEPAANNDGTPTGANDAPDATSHADTWQPYLPSSVQQEVEWRRCRNDVRYFLNRWWSVPRSSDTDQRDRGFGVVPFQPYPYQTEVLDLLHGGCNRLFVLKARQIGFTTLIAGYLCWVAMFQPLSLCIVISRVEREAKRVISNVRHGGLEHLPDWMTSRSPIANRASMLLEFENGSVIESAASQGEPARGTTPRVIVLDEWAHFRDSESVWRSAGPAAEHGGTIIAMSTAKGAGTPFHQQWERAVDGRSQFTPRFYGYFAHPDRTAETYARDAAENDRRYMAEEYPRTPEEAFVYSGSPIFDPELVERQGPIRTPQRGRIEDGEFKTGLNTTDSDLRLKVWEHPEPGKAYSLGLDPSEPSDHGDPCSIHVCNENGRVVAHWHGNDKSINVLAATVLDIARYFNDAFVIIEKNGGFGASIISLIVDLGYMHLYVQPRSSGGQTSKGPGFWMSTESKRNIMGQLQVAMFENRLQLPCADTKRELGEFQAYPNGRMEGPVGGHDDRVISLALAVHATTWISDVPTAESIEVLPTNTISAFLKRAEEQAQWNSNTGSTLDVLKRRYSHGDADVSL